jgi:hypothetical protein
MVSLDNAEFVECRKERAGSEGIRGFLPVEKALFLIHIYVRGCWVVAACAGDETAISSTSAASSWR